ncbi:hypothetical protein HANVADRAFT_106999 [Hanseniaspora valbyensis NRRL Y-1626]|uniref:Sorting nexin MVP1 n=1 Tax=Hanseniaspora valbyensis NRRL Y-1626 TaxID=766949 RepID=A0A1B7T7B5_9ASCO|nr:hypothetical protein HANVADRAFT_106999 [Hanseniaspora valbyensis NRRL Y-1626]
MEHTSDENPWGSNDAKPSSPIKAPNLFEFDSNKAESLPPWESNNNINKKTVNISSSVNIFEENSGSIDSKRYEENNHDSRTGNTKNKNLSTENPKKDLSEWFNDLRHDYAKFIEFSSTITIKQLEPKGLAFFKHIEYELSAVIDGNFKYVTTRRYSDFSWLLEYLIQKYPFRLLPELPPKIIPKNDLKVLKKRLDGLVHFSKIILNHPVISKNDIVDVFFQVDCEFATWRKNNKNKIDFSEEFLNLKIEQSFLTCWDKKYMVLFVKSLGTLDTQISIWEKLIQHIERHYAKQKSLFNEEFVMIQQLKELSEKEFLNDTFSLIDALDYLEIHETKTFLKDTNKCFNDLVELPKTEHYFTENFDTIISSFYILLLIFRSMKLLKERFDCLSGNNILILNDKIESNIQYLNKLIKNSPDSKSQEYDSIQKTIIRDKIELREQLNRQWLVKKCIMEEFLWFNEFNKYIKENTLSQYIKENSQFMNICTSKWIEMMEL